MAIVLGIYIAVLGIFCFSNYRKYGFNGATFLIGLYLFGAVAAVLLAFITDFYEEWRLDVIAILYHSLCLILFLYPVVYITNRYLLNFNMPNEKGLKLLQNIIIGISLFSFASYLPKIIDVIAVGDFKDARNMYNYGTLHEEEATGVVGYLGAIGSALSFFSLYFCFYNLKNNPDKKTLILLLLICSLTDVLNGLSMVGRGGIMRWLLMVVFFYLSFYQHIDLKVKKLVNRLLLLLVTPATIFFLIITVDRFSSREYPVYVYMLDYIGQSFIYFSYIFDQLYEPTFGGRMNFPILFPGETLDRNLSEVIYTDYSLNTFATFVGSFYKDMGFVTTLTIAFLFFLTFLLLYRFSRKPRSFYKLFLFIIFSQMIINGVFYFQYTGTTKIRSFILLIVLALFFQLKYKRRLKKQIKGI